LVPKVGVGVAYNNGKSVSHEGIKSRFRGGGAVLGRGIQIRVGVRRNRLQKWRAASLNTGFQAF